MNIVKLQAKIEDVVKELGVALGEAEMVDAGRAALEKSQYVNSERARNLSSQEVQMRKQREEVEAQKKYIDEQNRSLGQVLKKIVVEKESLKTLIDEKLVLEKEKAIFETEKKSLETLKQEKEEFQKEKEFFAREKLAMMELQKLLSVKEANIAAKEDRIDKRERMTEI